MSEKIGFEDLRIKYKDVLSKAFATNNIDLLDSFTKSTANEIDRRAAMDQAFRDKLLEILNDELEYLESLINFCINSCRRQMVTPTIPVVLLGDIFDALTLDKCEKMFTYVENAVNIWKEELFFVACKNNLLRMCNDLLRRLSRSQNTVFCGKILLFLAKFFPFSERSGLNIVSEFNLENVTEFGGDNLSNLKDSLDEEMVLDSEKAKTIDYNLYCKFWGLQDFFRNPNTCYNKLQWKTFVAHSGSVLSAFSSFKLEAIELQPAKLNRLKAVNPDVEMAESSKEQHYFAKFLTNQKLLELQLSDSNFRRCVLIQFLILFQYLTSSVKFKMETQELKSDQLEWVKETANLIYKLLCETPPDGKRFAECVQQIIKREEHWNQWKNDGCPEFQKPKPPVHDGVEEVKRSRKRRRPLGDILREYEEQDRFYMGNADLTRLWNYCPDNLEACRAKERNFLPALESYMSASVHESVRRRSAEGPWGWRALRLLARRSPHFFIHNNKPIGRLPDYLDDMVKRIADEAAMKAVANTNGNQADKSNKDSGEDEGNEVQMETDNYIEQGPDESQAVEVFERETPSSAITKLTAAQIEAVSTRLSDWKKLASKLGFKSDEIQFFESENPTNVARAKNMLQLWVDDDEDASVENLLYILEGLEMSEACDALKSDHVSPKKRAAGHTM